jgi:hypothetical protein
MAALIGFIIKLIIALVMSLLSSMFGGDDSESESGEDVWAGVATAGDAVATWWNNEDVSTLEKVSTIYTMAHVVAPDLTEKFADRVVDAGVSFVDKAGDLTTGIWDRVVEFAKDNPWLTAALVFVGYKVLTKD